ncbi:MAG: FtsX-like permease family protein [Spirochaetia bacterium]|nr:FtsX-like permease family protein [Spirochaetia bacterium]
MIQFGILAQIAFRNLFSNFLNVVIGGIVFVGTLLFVVGSSMLNSMDSAMSKSIIGSVSGHIQVYSSKSKDELALFGHFNEPDISEIPDFSIIKPALMEIENIKSVIPMGVNGAQVSYGNTLDVVLEKLRKAENKKRRGGHSIELKDQIESYKNHVRQIVSIIQKDFANLSVLSEARSEDSESVIALRKANSADFWKSFDNDPLGHLEFLENKIAFLIPDSDFYSIGYVGTDLDSFKKDFDRMEIVDGQMVPQGQRGLLLSKFVYEHQFKMKSAQRMDDIKEAIENRHSKIAKDTDLKFLIKQNKMQTREIIFQLDPISTNKLIKLLQTLLKSQETELASLLSGFFDVNDENFLERYRFFYSDIAPLVDLYRIRPGDMLTIKAFTKTGYIQSVNIKVYGTFQFKGLEKSGLAGGLSLMDLVSFRDLYGYLTPEKLLETKQLKKATGAKIIDRDKAEEELFGDSGSSIVSTTKQVNIDEKKELGVIQTIDTSINRIYSQSEIDKGVVLNAAIILKDPSKIKETMAKINEVSSKNHLDLKVVNWQKAAGFIGQFVGVAKVILYLVVFIIFIVALVIINNAVMMATLQRTKEIGTMRALGAQRSFVLSMILIETVILGLTFGLFGTIAGSFIVKLLGHYGFPAMNDFLYFFFSGPRLFPTLGAGSVFGAMAIIIIVTVISALYPALVAARVSPLTAMQAEE